MNRRTVERIVKGSPSRDTRIWSVIIVTKQDTYKSIAISEEKITKEKNGKSKQRDHDYHDDDRVTTAINDDLVILFDHESVNLVSDKSRMYS